jgi:hypothetical protein
MGIERRGLALLLRTLAMRYGGFHGLRLCELGNQRVAKSAFTIMRDVGLEPSIEELESLLLQLPLNPAAQLTTGKRLFSGMGLRHVSLDQNGEDGALAVDLSRPLWPANASVGLPPPGTCDAVTDFGTSEHVGEGAGFEGSAGWDAQYAAFRNVHDLARPHGGVMVHALPLAGCWPRHGAFEYSPAFFVALAREAGYQLHNLVVYRPRHDWTADQEEAFWAFVHARANCPNCTVTVARHDSAASEAPILAVLTRQGPQEFPSPLVFSHLEGLRRKEPPAGPEVAVACGRRILGDAELVEL